MREGAGSTVVSPKPAKLQARMPFRSCLVSGVKFWMSYEVSYGGVQILIKKQITESINKP
jgi:hypothetical protein